LRSKIRLNFVGPSQYTMVLFSVAPRDLRIHRIAVARCRAPFARLLSAARAARCSMLLCARSSCPLLDALIFSEAPSTIFAKGLFRKLGQLFLHETFCVARTLLRYFFIIIQTIMKHDSVRTLLSLFRAHGCPSCELTHLTLIIPPNKSYFLLMRQRNVPLF
jgi:uncharacterized integral membrane protein